VLDPLALRARQSRLVTAPQCAVSLVSSDARRLSSDNPIHEGPAENWASQRPPLVGRERERRILRSAFEAAATGQGALILLGGEPGIGKTAVCEQLASFVAVSGGWPLVGHRY